MGLTSTIDFCVRRGGGQLAGAHQGLPQAVDFRTQAMLILFGLLQGSALLGQSRLQAAIFRFAFFQGFFQRGVFRLQSG